MELAILIRIGAFLGIGLTISLVIVTGIIGASLARQQGLKVLKEIQAELSLGIMPAAHLLDGFLIFVAGVLLITPGILTDILGFSLLVPYTRGRAKLWIRNKLRTMMDTGSVSVFYGHR